MIGKDYDKEMYDRYFALQNSDLFQIKHQSIHSLTVFTCRFERKTAYDAGVGAGFSLDILLNKGLSSFVGSDLSPVMFQCLEAYAAKVDPSTKTKFFQGDITEKIQFEFVPFDYVISSYAMYVDSREKLKGYRSFVSRVFCRG